MTSLSDRPNTALVVIDVQNGVVADAHLRDEVIANINTLVDKARSERVPVIWVQHSTEDFSEYGMPPVDKVIAHTNMYWTCQGGPGLVADVVATADVSFAAAGPTTNG